ncbi:MAG: DUF1178 family protein [Pseudomonadota bacterium]
MISFNLICSKGHAFSAWFRGSQDFDAQVDKGLVACPQCGDTAITKGLMSPRVSTARNRANAAREVHQAMVAAQASVAAEKGTEQDSKVAGEIVPDAPAVPAFNLKDAPAPVKAYVETVRKLKKEIVANTEDVGSKFAEEARKMHLGETEERPIRGEATLEQAASLDEDGIDIFVIPELPEDGH